MSNKERYSELWISFTEGSEDAFAKIYDLAYEYLYSYGASFKVSDAQIRDIIQDVFIRLYIRPSLIETSETLYSYLLASVRNASFNILKAERKYIGLENILEFELNFSIHDDPLISEEERLQLYGDITIILDKLTDRQREIIHLRFLDEVSYAEIAEIMNLSEQTARNLVYRAMTKARKSGTKSSVLFLFAYII